ncbi:AraC family transcriptional regulator [Roseomonas sp. PWR1]|uniref:AraC family transcriptional regulator n=1 Tax=Roseomonas nitratireducens TaxID=2820810 RepID=A0ABS4ASI6_9PROT|nr:AraC family transcriptional regulator [Neoroseomonas nitratireducens]
MRVVKAAEDVLSAALRCAVYTQEIAAALGVSERFLTSAFAAVYRMSVHRYLCVRRLNLVRCALAGPQGATALVKTTALDLGFWHLGQFTREYRTLFGETPTDTLAKANGRSSAAPPEQRRP